MTRDSGTLIAGSPSAVDNVPARAPGFPSSTERYVGAVTTVGQWRKRLYATLAILLLATSALGLVLAASQGFAAWGMDFAVYWDAVHRWATSRSVYLPWQLAGPYEIHRPDAELAVLMPPTFLLAAAPFALLPREVASLLWVIVPVLVIAWAIYRMRPPAWSWPLLALLVAWPTTGLLVATGNPTVALTAVLALSLSTRYRWLAAFVLLKPSLAPFALLGARSHGWWIAVAIGALVSLPLLSLFPDWLRAIGNASDGGLLYSLAHVPTMALPVVAWLVSDPRNIEHVLFEVGREQRPLVGHDDPAVGRRPVKDVAVARVLD